MKIRALFRSILVLGLFPALAHAQTIGADDLAHLTSGKTKAINALWNENPISVQFRSTKRVVVADIKGPAEITMIHFAYPQNGALNRDAVLRIYWDDEKTPSVECPLVDFFCDPNGTREVVDTAMVNVRRGYNAYFTMPFRKSARIELDYDGAVAPGDQLWCMMPCYSYVCYRTLTDVPADTGYFCASWRQEALKLGQKEYVALDATGKGKFVGWNVTVRRPGSDYPVDENEKFFVDGESTASTEFQGLEDSFGFSWGFPQTESMFPRTGYFPFLNGAAAYRFFLQDAINFEKSLKVTIGFGALEDGFRKGYSAIGTSLQFSSTVYWYQIEPHAPLPPMPSAADRQPAPNKLYWPEEIKEPTPDDLKKLGVKLEDYCGRATGEIAYAEPGYSVLVDHGKPWSGWGGAIPSCLEDDKELDLTLNLPKGSKGLLRLYLYDPDSYMGGRKEAIVVGGASVGTYDNFQQGKWVEVPVGADKTVDGKLKIQLLNLNQAANVVLSKLEWVEK